MGKFPTNCPSCQTKLQVMKLNCPECGTTVEGDFPLPEWMELTEEEQIFGLEFIRSSGSLKKMASKMNRSYPSVRNYLDGIIEKLNKTKQ